MWIGPLGSFFFLEVFEPDLRAGLAVDGDHFGRNSGLRRDPGDKATLEWLRVERGQDVAQVVVRRRPVLERPEASEKRQLQSAEPGYVRNRLRPGDDGKQAQQQNLIERIFHLAPLPDVRQFFEVTKEDDRFVKRFHLLRRTFHRNPPIGESADSTDSALDRFVTNFFTRLPWERSRGAIQSDAE